jgi:hypothetical protein
VGIARARSPATGAAPHALRFTLKNNRIRSNAYVHPATHYAFSGTTGGADTLPTGARLRLRGDHDLASLPSDAARVVARTLQHHGMYLVDGGNSYISATTNAASVIAGGGQRSRPDQGLIRPVPSWWHSSLSSAISSSRAATARGDMSTPRGIGDTSVALSSLIRCSRSNTCSGAMLTT